jgi:hypothetical protein
MMAVVSLFLAWSFRTQLDKQPTLSGGTSWALLLAVRGRNLFVRSRNLFVRGRNLFVGGRDLFRRLGCG